MNSETIFIHNWVNELFSEENKAPWNDVWS